VLRILRRQETNLTRQLEEAIQETKRTDAVCITVRYATIVEKRRNSWTFSKRVGRGIKRSFTNRQTGTTILSRLKKELLPPLHKL
jgi:hypothetical protein